MKPVMIESITLLSLLSQSAVVAAELTNMMACNAVSTVFLAASTVTVTIMEQQTPQSDTINWSNYPDETILHTVVETRVISVETVTNGPSVHEKLGTANAYTGIGPSGWNSSSYQIKTPPASTAARVTAGAVVGTTLVKRLKARDASAEWITATIEGDIVSWENNYSPAVVEPTPSASSVAILPSPDVTTQAPLPYTSSTPPDFTPTSSIVFAADTTSTSTTASAPGTAPSCKSSSRPFIINFDDLPHFTITSSPSDRNIPPILNPYRKLYFDSHFGYVPPPSDPYPPHSPPQLAVYRGASTGRDGSTTIDDGLVIPGEFGAGPRSESDAYWINALSGFFGCADGSSNPCFLTIQGYIGVEPKQPSVAQVVVMAPCPGLTGCELVEVELRDDFRSLTGMQIHAAVGDKAVDYFTDDLKVEWSNRTCAAQAVRASSE